MSMRNNKRFVSLLLVLSLLVSLLSGCAKTETTSTASPSPTPEINVRVISPEPEPGEKELAMAETAAEEDSSIASMVYSAVNYDLRNKGFDTHSCIAVTSDTSFEEFGLGYYNRDFQLFDNPDYASVGFVTVASQGEDIMPIPEDSEYIAVEPIDGVFEDCDALYHILSYSFEDISSGHFVFEGKYVIYYQQDVTTVRFETYENIRSNYDLSLGSLYDYDNETFIYDADLFDGYETHSAVELFSEEDYAQLEEELRLLSEEQEKNGYVVQELNIVYISPESIEAYLASEEEDTFFGYSVSELESSLGKGTALVYTENGFQEAKYYDTNPEDYNWKSFLTKIGIGAGIILVGAVLAPVTGGVSFSCALITISKIAVTYAMVQALGTLTVNVASGMLDGHSFMESLKGAAFDGLDAFANGFMIGAVVGSVGVCSGLIKPTACFVAGTMVAVPSSTGTAYAPIEQLMPGDYVYSYDVAAGICSINLIIDTTVRRANTVVEVSVTDETITTTEDHPFYCLNRHGWVAAADLESGDELLLLNGNTASIDAIETKQFEEPLNVYNLTIDEDHTYFVGFASVLVHNSCDRVAYERREAVKEAWKTEVKAVKNGTSKYNWTTAELKELLATGKIAGYDGCHIVDVSVNPSLAGDPNNIILLKRFESFSGEVCHYMVHNYNWNNPSNWAEVVKVMPQFYDMIIAVGGAL